VLGSVDGSAKVGARLTAATSAGELGNDEPEVLDDDKDVVLPTVVPEVLVVPPPLVLVELADVEDVVVDEDVDAVAAASVKEAEKTFGLVKSFWS
jgi:hypothetical protein